MSFGIFTTWNCRVLAGDLMLFGFVVAFGRSGIMLTCGAMKTIRTFATGVKPFGDIPGPRSLPVVGTLWQYLPIFGKYEFDRLHENGLKKLKQFGPVVREEIVPGEPIVWIFRPEDVQELFRKEGRFPQRRSHLAIQHIRLHKPDVYRSGGLLPTNGEEWWRLRSNFQKVLSSPRSVKTFIPQVNSVLDDFTQHVKETHKPEHDFLHALNRLFLELLGVVAFNTRWNSFTANELKPDSRSSKLLTSALQANSCILKTDNGLQLWKYFPTPLYRKLKTAHDQMEHVAVEEVKKCLKKIKENSNRDEESLIESYLHSPLLDVKDVVGMAVDIILAGTDTTSYTSSFALYHLARNQDKQQKLYEEVEKIGNGAITADDLGGCHYVKAVLKETLRLNPVAVGIGRLLQEDAIFSNYHVPKGTVVVTQNQVVSKSPEYFKNPEKFIPERFLKNSEEYVATNPYLVLPFGHGSRTCIARRLAEQNIQLLLLKMVQKFSIEWLGGELNVRSLLINKPDGPIKLRLTQRK